MADWVELQASMAGEVVTENILYLPPGLPRASIYLIRNPEIYHA